MLELKNINKIYEAESRSEVKALTDISLTFRDCEFVSVLGPSGCGKTTLLNLIGGLDRYSSGEIIVDGKNTINFTAADWDTYRNHKIGFVFQSYNLIPQESVLENVELALALSGYPAAERKKRAMNALLKVGLENHLRKKPNQLSGGEMQRVAIARAIVNNPKILLADEPTGALDSKTGIAIMELLKEISKDRLVIMVTHNDALANAYSTRIIKLSDSKVLTDYNPFKVEKNIEKSECIIENADLKNDDKSANRSINGTFDKSGDAKNIKKLSRKQYQKLQQKQKKDRAEKGEDNKKGKKTSMSFGIALSLSLKNLLTKKTRTILMSVACSIGIVGLALVLALFNGLNIFIEKVQHDTLSTFPMSVVTYTQGEYENMISIIVDPDNYKTNPNKKDKIFVSHLMTQLNSAKTTNVITPEYIKYVDDMTNDEKYKEDIRSVNYSYGTSMNIYKKKVGISIGEQYIEAKNVAVPVSGYFKELIGGEEFILSQYDLVAGYYPQRKDELVLVLDKNNSITDTMLSAFLMDIKATQKDENGNFIVNEYEYDTFLDEESEFGTFTLALNNGLYVKSNENDDFYEKKTQSLEAQLARYGEHEANAIINLIKERGISIPECYCGDAGNSMTLKIVGILRLNEKTTAGAMGVYPIGYTHELAEFIREDAGKSDIVKAQKAEYERAKNDDSQEGGCRDLLSGGDKFIYKNTDDKGNKLTEQKKDELFESAMRKIGYPEKPNKIEFYAQSFEGKTRIKEHLKDFNEGRDEGEEIYVTDTVSTVMGVVKIFMNAIISILLSLTAISLVVAAIMIAIITYVSVIERTREIGILRSIGARKIDIANVFNAETIIIGAFAGLLGILFAFILQWPLNALLFEFTDIAGLAVLSPLHGLLLVVISIAITFLSGAIPAILAAKRDPVKALRSE